MSKLIRAGDSVRITIPKQITDDLNIDVNEDKDKVRIIIDNEENDIGNDEILLVKLAWKKKGVVFGDG